MKKKEPVSFKEQVYACCMKQLNDNIQSLQAALNDLKSGSENEMKSSAGDKHETARAMMQLEDEKISRQLNETLKVKNDLEKIDITSVSPVIAAGSLIKANNMYFFLGIAFGKIIVDDKQVIAFSLHSPLGRKMAGLKTGAAAVINGIRYGIEDVQ
jgi:hypothetical protein